MGIKKHMFYIEMVNVPNKKIGDVSGASRDGKVKLEDSACDILAGSTVKRGANRSISLYFKAKFTKCIA